MKKELAAGMLAAMAWMGSAQATVQTYDFTAVVQDVTSIIGYTVSSSGEGKDPGTVINSGDIVTGRFSFDDAMPYWSPFPDPSVDPQSSASRSYSYMTIPNTTSLEYTIASIGFSFSNYYGSVTVENNANLGTDVFRVEGSRGTTYDDTTAGSIALINSTGTLFSNGTIPKALSLSDFDRTFMEARWNRPSDGGVVWANSVMTSLTRVEEVPEPASVALLITALAAAGLGARGRTKRVTGAA
jgi:hypothetical protein